MSATKRVTYWYPDGSNADAVERAKQAARDEGFVPATVARVEYTEDPVGWSVTLVIRPDPLSPGYRRGFERVIRAGIDGEWPVPPALDPTLP